MLSQLCTNFLYSIYRLAPESTRIQYRVFEREDGELFGVQRKTPLFPVWYFVTEMVGYDYYKAIEFETRQEAESWIQQRSDRND